MTACSHLSFQQVSHTSPEQSQPTLFSSNPPDLVVLWHGPQPSLHPTDKQVRALCRAVSNVHSGLLEAVLHRERHMFWVTVMLEVKTTTNVSSVSMPRELSLHLIWPKALGKILTKPLHFLARLQILLCHNTHYYVTNSANKDATEQFVLNTSAFLLQVFIGTSNGSHASHWTETAPRYWMRQLGCWSGAI